MGKKILDSKLLYAFLAIVASIALWFYVASVENTDAETTITKIPVTFLNESVLEERGLMISAGHGQTVTLTVSGSRTTLTNLEQNKDKIALTIDVSKITSPGEQSMAYTLELPSGYSSVNVVKQYPGNIEFTVSRCVDKEIEVETKFAGAVAEGYMRGDISVIPGKIAITGIESEVDQISHALVTVTAEDLTTTYTGELGYVLVDYQGNVLTDLDVQCSVETVTVTMPVLKTAEVPLSVKLVTGGGVTDVDKYVDCKIDPEYITVSGAEDDLTPLKGIVLGEIDLANVIGENTFEFEIPLSSTLDNITGVTKATVTVSIRGLETKLLDVDNIELIHAPEGFTAESVTKSLQVQVRGPKEALDLVLSHNLRVVADLAQIEAVSGRYTVPVKVYLDSTSDVGVIGGDYKIVVDLTKE